MELTGERGSLDEGVKAEGAKLVPLRRPHPALRGDGEVLFAGF